MKNVGMPERSTNNPFLVGESVQDSFIDLLEKNNDK